MIRWFMKIGNKEEDGKCKRDIYCDIAYSICPNWLALTSYTSQTLHKISNPDLSNNFTSSISLILIRARYNE